MFYNKYKNIRTEYKGRIYASKKEAEHAAELDLMKRAVNPAQRVIKVIPQYRMPLKINKIKIGCYVADLLVTFADGHEEVQDVKGFRTREYKLKKKIVEAIYNKKIIEY